MLSNELPVLGLQLQQYKAGVVFETGNPKSVAEAVWKIEEEYERYQKGARELYDSIDLKDRVEQVIERIYRTENCRDNKHD